MRNLGRCLEDFESDLRSVAVTRARAARESTLVMETAVVDMELAEELPPVSAPPQTMRTSIESESIDLDEGEPVFEITDIAEPPMPEDRMLPPCDGIPGEQCGF
jgi:hypothetical protein